MRRDAIIATGRSDYPNQVNNVLGFPFIFRGALDVRARKINEAMKQAAVHALAELARRGEAVPEVVRRAYPGEQLRLRRRTTSSRSPSTRACCCSSRPPSRRRRWRPAWRGRRSISSSTASVSSSVSARFRASSGARVDAASRLAHGLVMDATPPGYALDNPLAQRAEPKRRESTHRSARFYEDSIELGRELLERPKQGGGLDRVRVQHAKDRMTVWERIDVLTDREPNLLWQNWGRNLDGASIVTGVVSIGGRDVAVYGHDFTVRAGSMDATNGAKLANLIYLAGERGIPLIGMNDSAGAFVPAGVGGLDGYAEAFTALRKISGVVPSIMCMFGYNAGGGSYLPRQGSFMIQRDDTFFGLTGPGVVKSVLGEDVTPDDLGGPRVHGASGVSDLTAPTRSARCARRSACSPTCPTTTASSPPFRPTSDPIDRSTLEDRHAVAQDLQLAHRLQHAARRHAHPAADLRSRRLLRAAARPRAQRDHRLRAPRRPRGRLRRQQHRGGERADRRRRGVQDRALRPLLQHLQHPDDLHRGHDRLPARHATRRRAASC